MSNGKDPTNWVGIKRKFTPIGRDNGESYFQANTRMNVMGELRRRHGMAATNVPPVGAGVVGLVGSWSANGPFIAQITPGNVIQGVPAPKALWTDAYLANGGGDSCVLFATLQDAGTTSKLAQLNPPTDSCAGTITFQAIESGSGQGFTPYGYQVQVECFDAAGLIITYNSACLINQTVQYAMPEGTTNVSYDVTGGCNGGSTPGTWGIAVSTP